MANPSQVAASSSLAPVFFDWDLEEWVEVEGSGSGGTITSTLIVDIPDTTGQARIASAGVFGHDIGVYLADADIKPVISISGFGLTMGAGGASDPDWILSRTAANVATVAAGDQIRVPQNPSHANDLARKAYVDTFLPLAGGTLTGILLGAVGAAGTPSYSFTGDPNTGMYWVSADVIGFSTGGTQRAVIDANGIAVAGGSATAPTFNFISDTNTGIFLGGADQLAFSTGGTTKLMLGNSSATFNVPVVLPGNPSGSTHAANKGYVDTFLPLAGGTMTGAILGSASGSASAPAFAIDGDPDTGMYGDTANGIYISTGGVERMYVNASGISCSVPVRAPVRLINSGTSDTSTGSANLHSVVEFNDSSAHTFTVNPDSTYNAPIGTIINICRMGTGAVTIVAGSGVTIHTSASAMTLRAQYSECTLRKSAANTWVLSGDLG